jgi:hypothetical protein
MIRTLFYAIREVPTDTEWSTSSHALPVRFGSMNNYIFWGLGEVAASWGRLTGLGSYC